jgi:hypothetical protein
MMKNQHAVALGRRGGQQTEQERNKMKDMASRYGYVPRCEHSEKSQSANGGACERRCTKPHGHEGAHTLGGWALVSYGE